MPSDTYRELKAVLYSRKITYAVAANAIGISTTAFNNKINCISDFTIQEIRRLGVEYGFDPAIIFDTGLRNVTKRRNCN